MEGKVAMKKWLEVQENALNGTEEHSIKNTLGSTLLSLSLNNSDPPHNQEQPRTQSGWLQTKLKEVKKENQVLRSVLNHITEHYAVLQSQLLLAMQKQQSSSLRNNDDLQKDNMEEDMEKPVLPAWQLLNNGDPSPPDGCTTKAFAYAENIEKNIGRNLTCAYNVEGKTNKHIIAQEAKVIEGIGASEASCRKARVSIRARSDFSLMGDGCRWRKYGQKMAKGNPCPRAYYRCNMGTACPVRKQVQRCAVDETVFITTYEGNHNHSLPPGARSMASTTSAALNMFLSGSTTSLHGSTLPNPGLFFSSSTSAASTGLASATFYPSASCPTVTLDLTQPSTHNFLKSQRAISSNHWQPFPLSLHGDTQQSEGLYLSSNLSTMIPPERNLALVDVVSAAIIKDPSIKAALDAAVSSLTGDTSSIYNHSQRSRSDYDPSSKMPAVVLHQPRTMDQLI